MAPVIRIKGWQAATDLVTATAFTRLEDCEVTPELVVKINISKPRPQSQMEPPSAEQPTSQHDEIDDTASELSWLDFELNQVLTSTTIPSSEPIEDKNNQFAAGNEPPAPVEEVKPEPVLPPAETKPETEVTVKPENVSQEMEKPEEPDKQEEKPQEKPQEKPEEKPVEYRNIPPNLLSMLRREFDVGGDSEDYAMIEKMIFTLRDPLSATRINLPVKSNSCSHFECFDFENFCLFNRMSTGVQGALRRELIKKNIEIKRLEKGHTTQPPPAFVNPISIVQFRPRGQYPYPQFPHVQSYKPTVPSYKCPICNVKFELHQLYISDVFNFFVKTTPKTIDRIELRDLTRYRIVEDPVIQPDASLRKKKSESLHPEEIIVLSDDDEPAHEHNEPSDDETEEEIFVPTRNRQYQFDNIDAIFKQMMDGRHPPLHPQSAFPPHRPPEKDSYKGSGSWEDPVTLD